MLSAKNAIANSAKLERSIDTVDGASPCQVCGRGRGEGGMLRVFCHCVVQRQGEGGRVVLTHALAYLERMYCVCTC